MANLPVIFLAFANEREDEARYLRALAVEQRQLKAVLEQAVDAGLCELVIESNATIDSIMDTFQRARYKDRIAVFHYGGHADGFQLLLETETDRNEVAHGEGLVSFLGGQNSLQLIFLNGCVTHQQAEELTQAGVPAVIGTSNSINDKIATQLSSRFYAGLANGATLTRAWKEAQDEIKIKKGTGNVRGLYFRKEAKGEERFPWELYLREGAEIVQEWNLPEAVDNPLFGLPDLPLSYKLPDQPYRFLERYYEGHAEIFFGRSYAIRDLYERTAAAQGAPIILFYGQSGVGKSSLLDAGLLPRLRQDFEVVYARRSQRIGLGDTLGRALRQVSGASSVEEGPIRSYSGAQFKREQEAERIQQMEALAAGMEGEAKAQILQVLADLKSQNGHSPSSVSPTDIPSTTSLLEQWKAIETATGRPLVILLDQAEEMFTRPWGHQRDELQAFLEEIKAIFGRGDRRPRGKLILSYRKEYNPEIEEAFRKQKLPREKVFLKQLSKKDITEVVHGLERTERLKNLYHLSIEPGLGEIIADDLLEDKDSPIAPVLQILLTKMWLNVEQEENRYFTIAAYQELRKDGILMEDFLEEQLSKCRRWRADIVDSGLALDLLNYHTTSLGTAETHNLSEIQARYAHRQDVLDDLVSKLKELYLLTDAGAGMTGLAHDTLAPLVKQMIRNSDQPGHRALRIIQQKTPEYVKDHENVIDEADLKIVEAGYLGMRMWSDTERELVEASRKKRVKAARFRKNLRRLAVLAVLLILMGLVWALYEQGVAVERAEFAKKKEAEALAAKDSLATTNSELKTTLINLDLAKKAVEDSAKAAKLARDKEILANQELNKTLIDLDKTNANLRAAKQRADDSTRAAVAARLIAEDRKRQADTAKALAKTNEARADSLRELSLAKTLAIKSLGVEQDSTQGILAMQAYALNKAKNGDPLDPDIFRALHDAWQTFEGHQRNQYRAHDSNAQVRALRYTSNGRLFSTGSDGRLFEWQIGDAFTPPRASPPLTEVPQVNLALAASSQGDWLAGTNWRVGTSSTKSLQEFPVAQSPLAAIEIGAFPQGDAQQLTFLPGQNAFFFTSRADDTLRYYHLDQKRVKPVSTTGAISRALAISPDGRWLALITDRGDILLYSLNPPSLPDQLPAPEIIFHGSPAIAGKQYAIAFSKLMANGQYQLACGLGKKEKTEIHLFTLNSAGRRVQHDHFLGHNAPINEIVFHSQGALMASASQDGTTRIWQTAKPLDLPIVLEYVSAASNRKVWATTLSFSRGGRELITGYNDGMVKVWPVYASDIAKELCPLLQGKQLSQEEWIRYANTTEKLSEYQCN